MDKTALWERYKQYLFVDDKSGLMLDISRINFSTGFFHAMEPLMQKAYSGMAELEAGAIANPDEGRMVGHYWLRNPALSSSIEVRNDIESTISRIKTFCSDIHAGRIAPPQKGLFRNFLVVGIGGSALGPQFIADALSTQKMRPYFLDNTDPDGMDRVFRSLGTSLPETLVIVISKSGGTKETRNGLIETKEVYKNAGLEFHRHAVAVTGRGSELDRLAVNEKWLETFPMWDWVGGRTSATSAVGLLPAALQGAMIDSLLAGAKRCDELTRRRETLDNPAAMLALMWYSATNGRGAKDMVILPYKDSLILFSRYLQQLIMESLGKNLDLDGNEVCQGIAVYGNKGATDQHAYVQQLRDGINNFFVTFIEVLKDRADGTLEVEPGITSGDYLNGFYLGTRQALHEKGRESITITIETVNEFSVGMLIALYERAVGLYASLININAYHQPGVEAGKKAAANVLKLQTAISDYLAKFNDRALSADEIAEGIGYHEEAETVFKIAEHMQANHRGILLEEDGHITGRRYKKAED